MTKDVMRPPAARVRSEISKAVGRLERLKLRRRALVKKLDALDQEIRQAKRFAAALIEDAAPEIHEPALDSGSLDALSGTTAQP